MFCEDRGKSVVSLASAERIVGEVRVVVSFTASNPLPKCSVFLSCPVDASTSAGGKV